MDALTIINVPISEFVCEACSEERKSKQQREGTYIPFHVALVSVPNEDDIEPLTIPIDVKSISWHREAAGQYRASAEIMIACPCCQQPRVLKRFLQAPLLFLTETGTCRTCNGELVLQQETVDYRDDGNGGWQVDINAQLVCHACSWVNSMNLHVPVAPWGDLRMSEAIDVDVSASIARVRQLPGLAPIGTGVGRDPSPLIFVSYRRADSAVVTGRICEQLLRQFGPNSVLWDISSIPYGVDFRAFIVNSLSKCSVLLAVIGPKWLGVIDDGGRRRIDDPEDMVRIELETAIRRDIPIIPLFVSEAQMPAVELLPEPLQPLHRRNGLSIRPDPDFLVDIHRLIEALQAYGHR